MQTGSINPAPMPRHRFIAIDGKTLRQSFDAFADCREISPRPIGRRPPKSYTNLQQP
jgi:hypothetical protein